MRTFYIPRAVAGQTFCNLVRTENTPKDVLRTSGEPIATWNDVRFHMDVKFPTQRGLADYVKNLHGDVVVSARLKHLVAGMQPALQSLPIAIVDHDGAVASADYWCLNPCPLFDAIDLAASEVTWNAIDPTEISGCEQLVLDEGRVPADRHLFRLAQLRSEVVMSSMLVDAIKAAGMTGIKFDRVDEFDY